MNIKLDKLLRKALQEQLKRKKPGECQKYVRLVLDEHVSQSDLGQELLQQLPATHTKYVVRKLPLSNCILWERSIGQLELQSTVENTTVLNDNWQVEKQVMQLVTSADFKKKLKDNTLQSMGAQLHLHYPQAQHTVLVLQDESITNIGNANVLAAAHIELQVLHNVNVMNVVANAEALLSQLLRYTKSIAEAPYKQQKTETLHNFKKYLANDKKQCVRVEKRNGFGRLWQQHLTRLPAVTLEVAETIISQYNCPLTLITSLSNQPVDTIHTLSELKVNRGAPQLLEHDRRLGQVLANKLHTLYTSRDANTLI